MKSLKRSKGFTIIEVLAVIAIMGILTAVIYSSFGGAQAKSRDQKRVSDINLIKLSLEAYLNKNGQYPVTLSALTPTFIASIPSSPNGGPSGSSYGYNYFPITQSSLDPSVCTSYQLWTTFENQNTYLLSKKGFNSSPPLTQCQGGTGIRVDASANPLIYDVTP